LNNVKKKTRQLPGETDNRTEINGKSTSMVWPTLGMRVVKEEQNGNINFGQKLCGFH